MFCFMNASGNRLFVFVGGGVLLFLFWKGLHFLFCVFVCFSLGLFCGFLLGVLGFFMGWGRGLNVFCLFSFFVVMHGL